MTGGMEPQVNSSDPWCFYSLPHRSLRVCPNPRGCDCICVLPPGHSGPHKCQWMVDDDASTERMLDFILSDPDDPKYAHMYDDGRD